MTAVSREGSAGVSGHVRAALARLTWTGARRGIDELGADAHFAGRPHIENLGRMVIGAGLHLVSRPVISHLVTGPNGVLEIGADVSIGHGAAIAAHTRVSIANGAQIGPFVMIMDTDFHETGRRDAAGAATPIAIGAAARIGSHVTILRGADVGAGSTIASWSVVAGRIPPDSYASGVPARVPDAYGEGAVSDGPIAERIRETVRRTFGLRLAPADSELTTDVPGWDSLGTLNLLLSLEEEFAIELGTQELLGVRRMGDLLAMVDQARRRG